MTKSNEIAEILICIEDDDSIFDAYSQRAQRLPCAGPGNALARGALENRAVRTAHDRAFVLRQEFIRSPVERVAGVRTPIHIRKDSIAVPYEKSAQRPIASADLEGA